MKQKKNLQKISNEDSKFFIKTFEDYSKFFDANAISNFFSAIIDLYLSANISSRHPIFDVKDKQLLQSDNAFKEKLIGMMNTMLSFLDEKKSEELSNYRFIFESYFDNFRNEQMEKKRITAQGQQQKSATLKHKNTKLQSKSTKRQQSTTQRQKNTTQQQLIKALHNYADQKGISGQNIQKLLNDEVIIHNIDSILGSFLQKEK